MPALKIGLTGGIGCGKTTVSRLFEALGVPVIDADVIAHEITHNNHPALQMIRHSFGPEYVRDGSLDRDRMRKRVFEQPEERKRLESILHPIIRNRMDKLAADCSEPYCMLSIPLLAEGGDHESRVDRVLVVDTRDELRREWIKLRSGLTDDEIDGIFSAQASREARLAIADDVIVNDGPIEALEEKVGRLHSKYQALAADRR